MNAQPNLLFILTDEWAAKATGYNGDPNVRTPHIDRLAAESVDLANTISVCPICTPARAALLTGRFPTSTGMLLNDLHLPESEQAWGHLFAQAGYDTGYIGKWHVDGHGRSTPIPPERRQGFAFWMGAECSHLYQKSFYNTGEETENRIWDGYDAFAQTDAACTWLRERRARGRPFNLVLSYGGPHFPHATAPAEDRARYPVQELQLPANVADTLPPGVDDYEYVSAYWNWPPPLPLTEAILRGELQGYYAHCTAIDRCVGRLRATLAELELAEDTIVVFTSDHGDMLGTHHLPIGVKQYPWDESARVPMLVHDPRLASRAGTRCQVPLTTPDILPTLLSLCGIAIPDAIEGCDRLAAIRGVPSAADERPALYMLPIPFGNKQDCSPYRALRTATHTYVATREGPWLLYDDVADPYQLRNLVRDPRHAALIADMQSRLAAELTRIGDPFAAPEWYLDQWGLPAQDPARAFHQTGIAPTPHRHRQA